MGKILKYIQKREWLFILASLVFVLIQVRLELLLPDYMKEITVLVQTPGSDTKAIWNAGIVMVLCSFGSLLASVGTMYFTARVAAGYSRNVRVRQFENVQSFSLKEISKFSTASLITRATNDVSQVQMGLVMCLHIALKAPITAIWAISKIAGKGFEWTLATGVAVAVLLVTLAIVVSISFPRFMKMQTFTDNLNKVTHENLTGLRVVRAYNAEEYQEQKFEKVNEELTNNNLKVFKMMIILNPGMSLIMNGLGLSIYWIGVYLIESANMMNKIAVFSDMVVFMNYAVQVVMSFMLLSMIFIMIPRAIAAAKRIDEVIATKTTIVGGSKVTTKDVNSVGNDVVFENVSFKYPDGADYALKDINFEAKAGQIVAFIGSTGSGKSTLVNLIPRFFDVPEGRIIIGGVDVRDYELEALRMKFGYVPQTAVMFTGTVNENVGFGQRADREYSSEDIKAALDISQSEEFVSKMLDGKESRIAQGGKNLSGGQKQRLSIARAIARDPKIYIFDDSFSALDYKTERQVRDGLKKVAKDSITFIVAQRIGTIRECDKIVVLNEGLIAGIGTHSELMKNCEVYQEIALSQLSKEELE